MATIKEIAQRAGVSTTTVSNVIHGKTKKVSPANIQKIENLIREMGYVQKMGLRVLNKEKSQLIAVVIKECGYEHIQVCAGRDNGVDHLRYMGAQRAAKDFAKKKQKVQFTALGMNYAKRKESYAWLLQRKKTKAALFFLSDLYALEAISFFSSRGVKIPEEIGIAGYDNISYAEFSVPRLTTISQNVEQKASLAVEILMERINGVEKERENEIMLPVTLIPRRSVQPQHEEK